MLKYRLSIILIVLLHLLGGGMLSAQKVIVNVSPKQNPLPPQASEYMANPGKFINLSLTSTFSDQDIPVRLEVEVQGPIEGGLNVWPNGSSYLKVYADRNLSHSFVLRPNHTTQLNMTELRQHFMQYDNLTEMFSGGAIREIFDMGNATGLLPEGHYGLKVTVKSNEPGNPGDWLGEGECYFDICYKASAPTFFEPSRDNYDFTTDENGYIELPFPEMIPRFSWSEPTFNLMGGTKKAHFMYRFTLTEVRDGMSELGMSLDALENGAIAFEQNGLITPYINIPYNVVETLKRSRSKHFLAQVQAVPIINDVMHPEFTMVENNGLSDILAIYFDKSDGEGAVDTDVVPEEEDLRQYPITATISPKMTIMTNLIEPYIEQPGSLFTVSLENTSSKDIDVSLLLQYHKENWGVCASPNSQHDDRFITLKAKEKVVLSEEQLNNLAGDYDYDQDAIIFKAKSGFIIGKPTEDHFTESDYNVSLRVCYFTGQRVLRERLAGKVRNSYKTDERVLTDEKLLLTFENKMDKLPTEAQLYFEHPERLFKISIKNLSANDQRIRPALSFNFGGESVYSGDYDSRENPYITLKSNEEKVFSDEEMLQYFGNFTEVLQWSGTQSTPLKVDELKTLKMSTDDNLGTLTIYNAEQLEQYEAGDPKRLEKAKMQELGLAFSTSKFVRMGNLEIKFKANYTPMPYDYSYYLHEPYRIFSAEVKNVGKKKLRLRPELNLIMTNFDDEVYLRAKDSGSKELFELEPGQTYTLSEEIWKACCTGDEMMAYAPEADEPVAVSQDEINFTVDGMDQAILLLHNVDSLEKIDASHPEYRQRCIEGASETSFSVGKDKVLLDVDVSITPLLKEMPEKVAPYFARAYSLWDIEISNKTQQPKKAKLVLTYRFKGDAATYTTVKQKNLELTVDLKGGETRKLTRKEVSDLFCSEELLSRPTAQKEKPWEPLALKDLKVVCGSSDNYVTLSVYDAEAIAQSENKAIAEEYLIGQSEVEIFGHPGVEVDDIIVTVKGKINPMPTDGNHYFKNPGILFDVTLENTAVEDQRVLPVMNFILSEDGSYYGGAPKTRLDSSFVMKPSEKVTLTGFQLNRCCGFFEEINRYFTTLKGREIEKITEFEKLVKEGIDNVAHVTVYNVDTLRAVPESDGTRTSRAYLGQGKTEFRADEKVVVTNFAVKASPKKELKFPRKPEEYFKNPGKYFNVSITNISGEDAKVNLRLTYNDKYCIDKPDSLILIKRDETHDLTPEEINRLCGQKDVDKIYQINDQRKLVVAESPNEIQFPGGRNPMTALVWRKKTVEKEEGFKVDSLAKVDTAFVATFREVKIGKYILVMEDVKKDSVNKKTGDDCYTGEGFVKWDPMDFPLGINCEFKGLNVNSKGIVTKGEVRSRKNKSLFSWDDVQTKLKGVAPEKYKDSLNVRLEGSQIADYYAYVKDGMEFIDLVSTGRLTLPARLPESITKDSPVEAQLTSMYFTPDTATMNVLVEFVMPESNYAKTSEGILVFSAEELPVGEDTWFPKTGIVKLISDFTVLDPQTGFDFTFLAPTNKEGEKLDDGCYVAWGNGKFKEVTVDATLSIPSEEILKANPENPMDEDAPLDLTPNIRLTASIADAEDWYGRISMDPFQFKRAPGYTFKLASGEGMIYDHSKVKTPRGVKIPKNYAWDGDDPAKNDINMWQGFYLDTLSVSLPKFIELNEKGSNRRLELGLGGMICDQYGFSCELFANNVLKHSTAKLGGWGISIDTVSLSIRQNNFDQFGFTGAFDIPLLKGWVGYACDVYSIKNGEGEVGNKLCFETRQADSLSIDFWLAEAIFDKEKTYFNVTYTDFPKAELGEKNTMVELCAGGVVDITCTDKLDFLFKGFKFDGLRVANYSEEVKGKLAMAAAKDQGKKDQGNKAPGNKDQANKDQANKGQGTSGSDKAKSDKEEENHGFSLTMKTKNKEYHDDGGNIFFSTGSWSFASEQKYYWGLPIKLSTIELKTEGTDKLGLHIGGGISIMGKDECGLAALAGVTVWGKIDWDKLDLDYEETTFDSLSVEGNFGGVVYAKGLLSICDDDDKSGFEGELDIKVKGLFNLEAKGSYYDVKKTEANFKADDEGEKKDSTFKAGYFYGEVSDLKVFNIGAVNINKLCGGLYINYGMPKDVDLTEKGELKKALKAPVIRYKNYGGAFGLGLAVGDDSFVKGDLTLMTIIDMTNGGKVSDLHLQGNVHALCAPDSDDGLVNAQADILYSDNTTEKKDADECKRFKINITTTAGTSFDKMYKEFTGQDFKVPDALANLQQFSQEAADEQGDGSNGSDQSTVDANGNRNMSKAEQEAESESGLGKVGATLNLELEVRHYPYKTEKKKTMWHLYLGQPDEQERLRITFIDFAIGKDKPVGLWAKLYANAYLCLGNELPNNGALPPLPDLIQEALGMKGADGEVHDYKSKLEQVREETIKNGPAGNIDGGIMFGAALGGEFGCNAVFCYADVKAMLGFDMILKKFTSDCLCTDGKPMGGKNGFYATGQLYAMLSGELGLMINLWIFEGKIPLVDMSVGALLKGGFPNPSWAYGRLRAKAEILGGLIKFNSTIEAKVGRVCIPEYGNPLDDIKIFGDVTPGADDLAKGWDPKDAASCYVNPSFTTNMKVGTRIPLLDEGQRARKAGMNGDESKYTTGALRTYIFHLDDLFLMETFDKNAETDENPVTSNYVAHRSMDQENHTMVMGSLEPDTRYKITLKGYCKELVNGKEVDPRFKDKHSNYKTVNRPWSQECLAYFVTGKLSDNIISDVKGFVPMDGIDPGGNLKEVTQPYAMLAHDRSDYFENPNYQFFGTIQEYPKGMSKSEIKKQEGRYPDLEYDPDGHRLPGQKSAFENIVVDQFTEIGQFERKNYLIAPQTYKFYNMGVKSPLPGQYFRTDKTYRFRIYRVHLDQLQNFIDNIEENYESIIKMNKEDRDAFEKDLADMKNSKDSTIRKDLYNYYQEMEAEYGEADADQRLREYADEMKTQNNAFTEVVLDTCYGYNGTANFKEQFQNEKHLFGIWSHLPEIRLDKADFGGKQRTRFNDPYLALNYWQSVAAVYQKPRSSKGFDLCRRAFMNDPQGMSYIAKDAKLRQFMVRDIQLSNDDFTKSYAAEYAKLDPQKEWLRPNLYTTDKYGSRTRIWCDYEDRTSGNMILDYYYSNVHNIRYCDAVMARAVTEMIHDKWNEYTDNASYAEYTATMAGKGKKSKKTFFKKFKSQMEQAYDENIFLVTHGAGVDSTKAENTYVNDYYKDSNMGTIRLHETQIGLMMAASRSDYNLGLGFSNNSYADRYIAGGEPLFDLSKVIYPESYQWTVRRPNGYNVSNDNPGFGLLPSSATDYQFTVKFNAKDQHYGEDKHYEFQDDQDIDYVVMPDDNFREYILFNYDTNRDGKLQYAEAEQVKKIHYEKDWHEIVSLQGIETMKNLEELTIVNNKGRLKELNLTNNTKVKRIDLHQAGLRKLDVTSLKDLDVLSISYNDLQKIDVSNCKKLRELYVSGNKLKKLDLQGLKQLTGVLADGNQFTELDLTDANRLSRVYVGKQKTDDFCHVKFGRVSSRVLQDMLNSGAKDASKVDLTKLRPENIATGYNNDGRSNTNVVFYAETPTFWNLDENLVRHLKKTYGTKSGKAIRNKVTGDYVQETHDQPEGTKSNAQSPLQEDATLDVSAMQADKKAALEAMLANNKDLEIVDHDFYSEDMMFENMKKAHTLTATSLGIKSIDNLDLWMPNLQEINVSGNKLERIDLSFFPRLKHLDISYNRVHDITFPAACQVDEFDCTGNQFTYIDLKEMTNLKVLHCGHNPIEKIWTESGENLEVLHCNDISLRGIDLSKMAKLKDLDISNNAFTTGQSGDGQVANLVLPTNKTMLTRIVMSDFTDGVNDFKVDLSDFTNLKYIDISETPNVKKLVLPQGIEQVRARHCGHLDFISPYDLGDLPNLTTFDIAYSSAEVTLPEGVSRLEEIDITDVLSYSSGRYFYVYGKNRGANINLPNLRVLKVGVPSQKKGDKVRLNLKTRDMLTLWENTWSHYPENQHTVVAYFEGKPVDAEIEEKLETVSEEDEELRADMGSYYETLKKKYNPDGRVLHAKDIRDITALDCSEQHIENLTGIVKWMPKLERLNASRNNIKEVALHFLRNLQEVDLSYNGDLKYVYLRPSQLADKYLIRDQKHVCQNLRTLDVSRTSVFSDPKTMEMAVILVKDRIKAVGASGNAKIIIGSNVLTRTLDFTNASASIRFVSNKYEPIDFYRPSALPSGKGTVSEATYEVGGNELNVNLGQRPSSGQSADSQPQKELGKGTMPGISGRGTIGGSHKEMSTGIPATITPSRSNQAIGNQTRAVMGQQRGQHVGNTPMQKKTATATQQEESKGDQNTGGPVRRVSTPRRLSLPAPDRVPEFWEIEQEDTIRTLHESEQKLTRVGNGGKSVSRTAGTVTLADRPAQDDEDNAPIRRSDSGFGGGVMASSFENPLNFDTGARGKLDSLMCQGMTGSVTMGAVDGLHAMKIFQFGGSSANLYFETADLALRWFFVWSGMRPESLKTKVNVLSRLGSRSEYRVYTVEQLLEAAHKGIVERGDHFADYVRNVNAWMELEKQQKLREKNNFEDKNERQQHTPLFNHSEKQQAGPSKVSKKK